MTELLEVPIGCERPPDNPHYAWPVAGWNAVGQFQAWYSHVKAAREDGCTQWRIY